MKKLTNGTGATRCLWIDLDGTVRHGFDELGRFVNSADDVVLFDGVKDALHRYKAAGWRIVGVSNQGGIATGQVSVANVQAAMARTHELTGKVFDRISWCSHHPAAPDPEMAVCWCRKPRIGMLIYAGSSLSDQHRECYPPHMGLFVGDRPEDKGCAENAALPFMLASEWRAHCAKGGIFEPAVGKESC